MFLKEFGFLLYIFEMKIFYMVQGPKKSFLEPTTIVYLSTHSYNEYIKLQNELKVRTSASIIKRLNNHLYLYFFNLHR